MELQSKFIEDTNEQYSIRNDGVVIKHYHITKYKTILLLNQELVIRQLDKTVQITINNIGKRLYINKLLFQYFNIKPIFISKAKPRDTSKNKDYTKKYRDKQIKNLSEYYIKSLNRNISELPKGLISFHRQIITAQRELKIQQRCQ